MSEFLEEITRENIKVGDFVIRNPERGKVYLGIVNKVNCDVLSIDTNHGDNVDRAFSMGYLINKFKKIKRENITEINDHSGHYFCIQEPVFKKGFFDYQTYSTQRDSVLSILQYEKYRWFDHKGHIGNLIMLDNNKVGDKINELEKSGFDFSIHIIHKVSFIISESHGSHGLIKQKRLLKSKIDKIILKTK